MSKSEMNKVCVLLGTALGPHLSDSNTLYVNLKCIEHRSAIVRKHITLTAIKGVSCRELPADRFRLQKDPGMDQNASGNLE